MPMTPAGLSAAIKTALDTKFPIESTHNGTQERQDFADAVAQAVVTYLQASATVIGTATCAAGGGPVVATVT